jgi:hypothetical protein
LNDIFYDYSYIYDVETGAWVLKLPDEERDPRFLTEAERRVSLDRAANTNEQALEEHGLLLAIQAAHEPSAMKATHAAKLRQGGSPRLPSHSHSSSSSSHLLLGDQSGNDWTDDDSPASFPTEIPPAELFLLVVAIHFMNCFINGFFVTLVPIWMVSITEKGGLDYGVRDCAMAISATGVALLLIQAYLGPKASMALKVFPVRALRIGAGCVTIFSFLLTKFSRLNGTSPWTAMPVHSASNLATANSGTWLLWTINSLCGHTYTVEADEAGSGGEGLFLYYRPTPASNILSVLLPAVLLSGIGTFVLRLFAFLLVLCVFVTVLTVVLCRVVSCGVVSCPLSSLLSPSEQCPASTSAGGRPPRCSRSR